MTHWKRRAFILGAIIAVLGLIFLAASFILSSFLVDWWWFSALGYELYFWQRLLYRYVIFTTATLFFFLIFFLNFWVASRYLGVTAPPPSSLKPTSLEVYRSLMKMFRTGSMWVYTPLSLLLTFPIAFPIFKEWEMFLFYVFGRNSGIQDPVYGNDISFYFFSLPIFTLLVNRLLLAFLLLLVGLGILYWLERRLLTQKQERLPRGAKLHLNIVLLLVFFFAVSTLFLQRYMLLYDNSHQPLFFGPGFAEMRIILPLIWLAIGLLIITALMFVYFINTRRYPKILGVCLALFVAALGLRYSSFLPSIVEKYIVKPNEISFEKPYITQNVESTLAAYQLTDVETRNFVPERIPVDVDSPGVLPILRNIPVWDGELLDPVYQQLQQLRTYYTFPKISVDRYMVNDLYLQVFLSARELSYEQLPSGARNWVNEHLSYTHGYGVVMTPAAQGGGEPLTWFIQGIPPQSAYGFNIERPSIYYGLEHYTYAIAPNNAGEIDYPKGNTNVLTNYRGSGGVSISSLFKKLVFAFHFKEKNVFFTTKTNAQSKILFRRNIVERIQRLAPFLLLDKAPYIVVTPEGLYWIQDAYIASTWFPYSAPHATEAGPLNYMRNSVKIVVDAYNGTVDFYMWDTADPIIRAYDQIYPGLLKRADELPQSLMRHVRYPQDFFDIQMSIYAKYHQTDPDVFYQQEDIWVFPRAYTYGTGREAEHIKPYYLTLDLIEPGRLDYLLLMPMLPRGRENLRALPIVGCDPPHYGKIIVYEFPKGELVYGPTQIYALIDQDPAIAQQLTLWNQIGSEIGRGKMVIFPVGNVMLYIQPVYLKSSSATKIPQLQRLIMSDGSHVVMEQSLEEAYVQLGEIMTREMERIQRRFAPLSTEPLAPGAGAPPEAPAPPPAGETQALPPAAGAEPEAPQTPTPVPTPSAEAG